MAMERLGQGNRMARSPALKGLAWFAGAVAWVAAAAIGAVLAVFFAATMVVIVLMATALLAVAGMALRARRTVRAPARDDILEARNIGGHSWVAYGWDGHR
jgi:cobalamin biosynthesis protein CobD/CbiB